MVDGDYIWKYTHNGYDFSILGNTPIFFPIDWHNSKIAGLPSASVCPIITGSPHSCHGPRQRALLPASGRRAGYNLGAGGDPFRIDHDEKFQQTTHLQYQPWASGPWIGFNWRYDSGLVAGAVPFAVDTTPNAREN